MPTPFRTAASLLAALASGSLVSCGASSDDGPDPNPSGGGGGGGNGAESPYAPYAEADAEFLRLYAETGRFRNGHPRAFAFLPDGSAVLFLRSGGRDVTTRLYLQPLPGGEERVLLTAEQLLGEDEEELTPEERARRERLRLTARGIARFELSSDGARLLIPVSGRLFVVERALLADGDAEAIRELTSDAGPVTDARFSPDARKIALVRAGDLYVVEDFETLEERRLTVRPGPHVENGLAEFIAQEEMARFRGFWWAPDSRTLAYQQTDTSGMEEMHILDPTHPEQPPASFPYPRPGKENATVRLGLLSLEVPAPTEGEGDGTELPPDQPPTTWVAWERSEFPYLATVQWAAAGPLTVLVQDRLQERQQLLRVDPASGATTPLLEESDEAWLELDQSVPRWLPGGERFLWAAEREGRWRLELRRADGELLRAVTEPDLGYRRLLASTAEAVWVEASSEPTESHVARVGLEEGAEPEILTEGRGLHSGSVSTRAGRWVHTALPLEGARTYTVRSVGGGDDADTAIASAAEAHPFAPNVTLEEVGDEAIRVAIVRPRAFDETLEYPVLVHVYGGPTTTYVNASAESYLLDQWFADQNYIVLRIDGRGTPHRGSAWQREVDGDLIHAPLIDQVRALQRVGDLHPELDLERVGIWGWSFGGYFSALAALRRPEVFRAAVAGAPVTDWRDYDTHYTERYLGLPDGDEGAARYDGSSVLVSAAEAAEAEAHRPILLIHGTADDNVYFSHALKLQEALLRAGRPTELLSLAGQTHMVPDRTLNERMHQRMVAFFETHLRR